MLSIEKIVEGTKRSLYGANIKYEHIYGHHKPVPICWDCFNAVPDESGKYGCSWSRILKPVKGANMAGNCVLDCPKFRGSKNDKRKETNTR